MFVCYAVCASVSCCVSLFSAVCWAVREPFGLGLIAKTPRWLCRLLMACLSIIQLAILVFVGNGMLGCCCLLVLLMACLAIIHMALFGVVVVVAVVVSLCNCLSTAGHSPLLLQY